MMTILAGPYASAVSGASFWGAQLAKAKLPAGAAHWRIIMVLVSAFLSAKRKRQETLAKEQQKRIRDASRLVREMEQKDPRMRRMSPR